MSGSPNPSEDRTWVERRREAIFIVVGLAGIVFESVLTFWGREPNVEIVGACLILLGFERVWQQRSGGHP